MAVKVRFRAVMLTILTLLLIGIPSVLAEQSYLEWRTTTLPSVLRVENQDRSGRLAPEAVEDRPTRAYSDNAAWEIEAVDSTGDVGYATAIALDQAGQPHINYYDANIFDPKYAYYDGTAWVSQTLSSESYGGRYASLALDAAGLPHISYLQEVVGDLKYAYYDGVAWHIELVDSTDDVGLFTSLALDSDGYLHISYNDITLADLKYAYFNGTAWITETVDSVDRTGFYTSLALDADGHPHISYLSYRRSDFIADLKYAYYDGLAWQIQTVDCSDDVGYTTSLQLDRDGYPHISYYDATNGWLKHAYYDGSTWQIEVVDSDPGLVGWDSSLALDAAGRPHISYCLGWPGLDYCDAVKYAYYDGLAWHIETVDDEGFVGDGCSLALDRNGQAHISYHDGSNRDLKYARRGCIPVSGVQVQGPPVLVAGQEGFYRASFDPLTATVPVTFTWDNGEIGPTAGYSWTVAGIFTPSISVTNFCGTGNGSLNVQVLAEWPYNVLLPLVFRTQ